MDETIKISEWLKTEIGSHTIYDSKGLGAYFKAKTGQEPNWPEHSTKDTRARIEARGLGGSLQTEETANAYGWEIAEALASKAGWQGAFQQGRGSRFRAAIQFLEQAGS